MTAKELLSRAYDTANETLHPIRFLDARTVEFQHRFTENNGCLCCAMFDYLPLHKKQEPTQDERIVRNLVFDFKNGIIPEICADMMASAMMREQMIGFDADTILFTIPASTIEKHTKRFQRFSRLLAGNLGIIDGFPMLEVVGDRVVGKKPPKRLADTIRLNDPDKILPGRSVFVVDDVYAKGHSFEAISDFLMAAGAKSVTGLFLACSMRDYR